MCAVEAELLPAPGGPVGWRLGTVLAFVLPVGALICFNASTTSVRRMLDRCGGA